MVDVIDGFNLLVVFGVDTGGSKSMNMKKHNYHDTCAIAL